MHKPDRFDSQTASGAGGVEGIGSAAIVCTGLTKDYGQEHGLFDLNLEIRRGEVFSVFSAFGHPYLAWPALSGLAVLLILPVPGGLLAAAIAERSPKVAQ